MEKRAEEGVQEGSILVPKGREGVEESLILCVISSFFSSEDSPGSRELNASKMDRLSPTLLAADQFSIFRRHVIVAGAVNYDSMRSGGGEIGRP